MNIKEALQRFEEYIEDSSLTKLDKPDGSGDYIYSSLKTTFDNPDFDITPAMENIVRGVLASAGGCYYRLHIDDHNGVIVFTASRANAGVKDGKFVTFEDDPTDLDSMGDPINDSMDDSTNLESVIDNPVENDSVDLDSVVFDSEIDLKDDSVDLDSVDLDSTGLDSTDLEDEKEEDDPTPYRSNQ